MKYFITSIILICFCFNFVLAQETDRTFGTETLDQFSQKIEDKIINPVKRLFDSAVKKEVEEKSQEVMEKTQETIEGKQEELFDKAQERITQEVKEYFKNWFQNKVEWVKDKLAPLKIKIQEGRDLIRGWIEKLKWGWK